MYNFDAQNSDELTISENEVIFVSNEECDEEGWAVVINDQGQKGYVPLNYLDMGDDEEEVAVHNDEPEQSQPWDHSMQYQEASELPKLPQEYYG